MSDHHDRVSTADATDHDGEHRQLLIATRQFAKEDRWTSWWHLIVTVALLVALWVIVALYEAFWMRAACSLLISLTMVRVFILYHDFMHQAIFKGSPVAGSILTFCGHLLLTPPAVWKRSHDHHHHHNSKLFGANIGSFPIMTKSGYLAAPRLRRLEYRLARSPFIIVFGYFSVFLLGMCFYPLLHDFRKNIAVLITLLVHFGTIALSVVFMGVAFTMFALVMPIFFAMLVGAYLFYVQHNFPSAQIRGGGDWTYADSALLASSFLETGKLLQWFLGNIGYHHVHHLNAKIPFYRLPDAMAGLPASQDAGRISFSLRDIIACLRLKLWDAEKNQFVPFPPLVAKS